MDWRRLGEAPARGRTGPVGRGRAGAGGPSPPYPRAGHGRSRPRPAGAFCRGRGGAERGCRGAPGPANGSPGSPWDAVRVGGAGAAGLGRGRERPRRLRPGPAGQGESRSEGCRPAGAARPTTIPRACRPGSAAAVAGGRNGGERRGRPRGAPPPGPGVPAGPGGRRPRGPAARAAPGGAFVCPTGPPFGGLGARSAVFLEHQLRGGRGTAPRAEPPPGRGPPGGPPRSAQSLPPQQRFAPARGGCAVAAGLFPGPAPGPNGGGRHLRDGDRGQVPRAPQPGQGDGIAPVGVAPLPWFWGAHCGRANPAEMAVGCARAGEPIATRPGCRATAQRGAFGRPGPDAVGDIARARPDGAESAHRSGVVWSHGGNGTRRFMDSHADGERARRWHGCPPRSWRCCGSMGRWLPAREPTVAPEGSLSLRKSFCLGARHN
jgi:hypothetical protein